MIARAGMRRPAALLRGLAVALSLPLLAAGCAMPRSAALQSEILRGTEDPLNGVQVVPVTRASLGELLHWPAAHPELRHNWRSTGASPAARTIRAGDLMSISVWDSQPDSLLTTTEQRVVTMNDVAVSASGRVFVPYVGEVRIAGMTTEQARREIQDRIAPIVPDGQVQLSVAPGAGNTIDVVTGVARPGRVQLPEISPTILSVLAEAGGIAPNLRNPLVRVNRAGSAMAIPARELFSNPANDIQMRGGDRVMVEEDHRNFVALGAAGRQEVVYFERERISVLDGISSMGGLVSNRANLEGVMILRQYPAGAVRSDGPYPRQREVIFTFDLTTADGLFAAEGFQIESGDVVLATESALPMFAQAMAMLRAGSQTVDSLGN
ncbi:polysaccharide export outer membrane protein [Pararhodobacter aggregans]|nr:polysaccharide export outer membrane protein [Pararhodobacter aggregans]